MAPTQQQPFAFRFLLLTLFLGCACILAASQLFSSFVPAAHSAGNPPTLLLPYASGTTGVSMGTSGLHGGNFSGVPGYPYTLNGSGSVTDASLDIGFVHQSSTSNQTVALASGTILIGYGNACNMVLMQTDANPNLWIEYIHMSNIPSNLTTGAHVNAGSPVGTPTTTYVCGEYGNSDFVHTHFAFLQQDSTYTAHFITMANSSGISTTLCGINVDYNSIAKHEPSGTIENLHGLTSAFTIPQCPGGTPTPTQPPAVLSISQGLPSTASATVGEPDTMTFQVMNSGQPGAPSLTINGLGITLTGPNGATYNMPEMSGPITLSQGQTATYQQTAPNWGKSCLTCFGGAYTAQATFISYGGQQVNFTGSGSQSNVAIADASSGVSVIRNSGDGHLEVFKRGTDGNIWHQWYGSGGWSSWSTVSSQPSGVYFIGTPSLALNAGGSVDVIVRDQNGAAWQNYQTTNGGWNGWNPLTSGQQPTLTGDGSEILNSSGNLEYFAVGADGYVWHDYQPWNNWGHLVSNPSGVTFTGRVTTTLDPGPPAEIEVFAQDTNGNIWHTWYTTSNGWLNWAQVPTPSTVLASGADVSAIINKYGSPEVFGVGTDGSIWHDYGPAGSSSGWNNWGRLVTNPGNVSFKGDIATTLLSNSNIELFAEDTTGQTWFTYYGNNGWLSWQRTQSSDLTGNIAAILNTSGYVETFARGSDGSIQHAYYQPNQYNQLQQLSGASITGTVSAVTNSSGGVEMFAVGSDGNVWHNYGYPYTNWGALNANPGVTFTGSVTAVLDGVSPAQIEVFARDTNGHIWHDYYTTSNGWMGWQQIAGATVSDIAASVNGGGGIEIFGVESSGNIWHNDSSSQATSSQWNNYGDLNAKPSGNNFVGAPKVILDTSNPTRYVHVFAHDSSGAMWTDAYSSGGWTGWQSLSGSTSFDVSPAINKSGSIEIFPILNGVVMHNYGAMNNWGTLNNNPSGVTFTGNTQAAMDSSGQLTIYARDTTGNLWDDYYSNSAGWTGWNELLSSGGVTSDPSIVTDALGTIESFNLGASNMVFQTYQDWYGWGSNGFTG